MSCPFIASKINLLIVRLISQEAAWKWANSEELIGAAKASTKKTSGALKKGVGRELIIHEPTAWKAVHGAMPPGLMSDFAKTLQPQVEALEQKYEMVNKMQRA
eukprot:2925079-Alexandrium_andersonii.AAC.1